MAAESKASLRRRIAEKNKQIADIYIHRQAHPEVSCANCSAAKPLTEDGAMFECRLNPPAPVGNGVWEWPKVKRNAACLKWAKNRDSWDWRNLA